MKRLKRLLIVLTLNIVWGACWVSSADAGVITLGTWTAMNPSAYPSVFWNNASWDGPEQNVGQILTRWGWPVEYLSNNGAPVAFAFDQSEFFWEATSVTSWLDGRGIWELPDGSIRFDTHGYTYNSLTTPQQFSLFRYVGPTMIVYFLGVEDIPSTMRSDNDYNDYVGYAIEYLPPPPPPQPTPTPEPATLALMLSGGLVGVWRKRRSLPLQRSSFGS
jgi:PEP-CTERM motif